MCGSLMLAGAVARVEGERESMVQGGTWGAKESFVCLMRWDDAVPSCLPSFLSVARMTNAFHGSLSSGEHEHKDGESDGTREGEEGVVKKDR